jgi:hypothetical protein
MWQPMPASFGVWYWHTEYLVNGWCAQVVDDSQMSAPQRQTHYRANAVCRFWIVSHPQKFDTLAEAKDVALELAMAQKAASSDPLCRVDIR